MGVCRDDKKALDVRMYDQFEFLKDHAAVSMPAFERARKGKFGILNATGNAASALLIGSCLPLCMPEATAGPLVWAL